MEHLEVATSLDQPAYLCNSQGNYDKAEPHERALVIREKVLGPEHSGMAITVNALAEPYNSQGKIDEAESLYKPTQLKGGGASTKDTQLVDEKNISSDTTGNTDTYLTTHDAHRIFKMQKLSCGLTINGTRKMTSA
ncbi:hypothetical protein BC936DRAFT_143454, partial [Jimgerdemannia flammicorona]